MDVLLWTIAFVAGDSSSVRGPDRLGACSRSDDCQIGYAGQLQQVVDDVTGKAGGCHKMRFSAKIHPSDILIASSPGSLQTAEENTSLNHAAICV